MLKLFERRICEKNPNSHLDNNYYGTLGSKTPKLLLFEEIPPSQSTNPSVDELKEKISKLESRISKLENKVDDTDTTTDSTKSPEYLLSRIGSLQGDFDKLEDKIEGRLGLKEKIEGVFGLEEKIRKLEGKIFGYNVSGIGGLENRVGDLESKIRELEFNQIMKRR